MVTRERRYGPSQLLVSDDDDIRFVPQADHVHIINAFIVLYCIVRPNFVVMLLLFCMLINYD